MKTFQRLLVAVPSFALLHAVMAPVSSLANENQLDLDSVQEYSIAQGATIRDFSDVYPTDWAYQALAELIDTYGCVSGYPDGTFRGQQPVTRFQMAAVLNSCLDSMSAKMEMMGEESMEDMAKLERLVASFEEEIITLKGTVDGLDAKVSELEENQFSTTTKASFKIATDFVYFASDDEIARSVVRIDEDEDGMPVLVRDGNDTSSVGISSKAELKFKTSFIGSDKLTFKLKGDVISGSNHYLAMGDFYDIPDGSTSVEFSGFTYETSLNLGGMSTNIIFGTDYADFDGVVGLDTYYGGSGYDGYGSDDIFGDFGDVGVGISIDLLSGNAGSLTVSGSVAVDADDASDQTSGKGILGGEDTDYSGAIALNWDGALFGGNDAMFTVMYRGIDYNNKTFTEIGSMLDIISPLGVLHNGNLGALIAYPELIVSPETAAGMYDAKQHDWKFVAGAYVTDKLSLSGSYAIGWMDYKVNGLPTDALSQWMVAVNYDDFIFEGSSAGIAYGSTSFLTKYKVPGYKVPTVIELYYSFKVNDYLEVPIYLDFISNSAMTSNSDAFGFAVRPTFTF